MNKVIFAMLIMCVLCPFSFATDAEEYLFRADRRLIPANARYRVHITTEESGRQSEYQLLAYKRGVDRYMFYTIEPTSIYGQSHLRVQEQMWTYFPLADTSIRLRYRSSFLGSGLSYADIMYNDLLDTYNIEDFDSAYIFTDFINNEWNNNNLSSLEVLRISLTLKPRSQGYARVVTYIEADSLLTIKREYYSLNGDLLKEIYFTNYELNSNTVQAFEIQIINSLNPNQVTYAHFYDIEERSNVPMRYFSTGFLRTYQPDF